jgi:hypothetical protein
MDAEFESARPPRAWLGSLALFCGVVLLVLCGIEAGSETGLTWMPRAWHTNQELSWVLGILSVAFGCWLLAPRALETTDWKPTRPGIRFRQVQFYTRQGCHLCDDAVHVLEQHRRWLPRVVVIDVDTDERLIEKFGDCVPVVVCDGKVRFRGGVPTELLRRLIEGTRPV